ncbi:hypothetical protein J2S36_000511 [Arcanobacterium hippocoleae]|uniref:Uncharacterized protein n=1 Tax=Arcanobacterium hippocoleae TaxID=149017 RepID=A0ABU1T0V8_9ACTO|nr:hypothetical protein [Arcanobacterium hippocoleae]
MSESLMTQITDNSTIAGNAVKSITLQNIMQIWWI